MKWQKKFGADRCRVMLTEKACCKYTLMDSKLSIKNAYLQDNFMKRSVHYSVVSKEKKFLGKKWKTKQKASCHDINPQCVQIRKSKSTPGCCMLKN